MLPRLRAEESLLRAEQIAFGTGSLERQAARELSTRWIRTAKVNGGPQKAKGDMLPAFGIGYRVVETRSE